MSDPTSPPALVDDRPRFRWVVPLFVGLSLGAVVGILITFVAVSGRSSGSMIVTNFDMRRVLSNSTTEQLSIQDSSTNLGRDSYNPVDGGTSVRRRIEVSGTLSNPADAGNLANKLKTQVEAEINRHGAYSSGSGSSSSSSGTRTRFVSESTFYKGSNRGQVDIVFHSVDNQVHVVILIHEPR
jgi:hypothetical protein